MPLDRSFVKAIVDRELTTLADQLGVNHWKISVFLGPSELGSDYSADCVRETPYDIATITLNPEKYETEKDVVSDLRHELFHVVLAPLDVFRTHHRVGLRRKAREQSDAIWRYAIEQAAINLNRMYHGLTAHKTKTPADVPVAKPKRQPAKRARGKKRPSP